MGCHYGVVGWSGVWINGHHDTLRAIFSGWSKEELLQAWMENPGTVCEEAGVVLPENLDIDNLDVVHGVPDPLSPGAEQAECGVCTTPCVPGVTMPCEHVFCKECWQQ